MAKQIRQEMPYDAPPADVAAMLADPAFREQVLANQRVLRGSVDIADGKVRIESVQPAKGIPSFAKKFVGDEITILQEETWSTPDHGDVLVTIPGKPGEMRGTATLTETSSGTLEVVALEVKVNIPLVGGKIEGLIADLLTKALRAEHKTGIAWLAGS